jgi:hypothetical protein
LNILVKIPYVRIETLETEYSCNLGCTASRKIKKLALDEGKGLELRREQIDYTTFLLARHIDTQID